MASRLDTELLITAGVNGLQHIDRLINSIDAAGGDTEQLREASQRLRDEWDNLSADEQAQRLRDLGNAANQGADDVDILGRNTDQTTNAFDRMIGTLKALGAMIGITFIIGKIKGFFTDAITGAADFEQQLATVQAVSGATTEQMGRIKAASEELGKSTRYNATQAAEGFEILARAGLDTEASLKTIPSVLALAQGNSLELAEAAGYVTKAVQGMGLTFDDSARVADVMAKAAASANTDVAGLGAALSYAAPSAAALGVSIEETAAYIGKFADAGVDASRAGTAFNSILSQFSNDASSFRRELGNINITTDDFNLAIRQLAEAGPAGQKAINALGMEAGPAFKALLSQGIGSLDELTDKLNNASGTAQEQADIMNNTWQGALAGLGSAWQSLKDTLGESFLGSMTQSFKDLGAEITSLVDSGKIKQFGDSVAAVFTEATTYVIDFIRNVDMSAILDKVSNSLDYLRGISTAANGAFQALSIAVQAVKSGFLAIGVAISMVVTIFADFLKLFVDGGSAIAKFFGLSTTAVDGLSASLGDALQASEDFREYATAEIAKSGESITNSFNSIAGSTDEAAIEVVSAGDQIADTFGGIVDAAFQGSQETGAAVDQIRTDVAAMIDGFDKPEQFAALIAAIVETGNEAVVGAELLSRLGAGAADGTEQAKVAADQATAAVEKLGNAAAEQAEATRQAIDGTFASLGIDVAQNLNGINSKTQQTFDLIAHGAKSISESTYSATEKASLLAALLAEGLNAAKTKEEFEALNEVTKHYGLSSVITADQQKILQAGMQGGAEAAKAAAEANTAQTVELTKNTEASAQNAQQSRAVAEAKKEQASAADKAAAATEKATQSESATLAHMERVTAAIKKRIFDLQDLGANTEQTDKAYERLLNSMGLVDGFRTSGIKDYAEIMMRVDAAVKRQAESFASAANRAKEMTQALSGTSVTSRDLADAQHALRKATDANVQGLIRMDDQTLDKLRGAIDSARQRMQGLTDDAKNTADQLEATLAKLQGNDDKAREIEQNRKLAEIEEKRREARKRGNSEEEAELNRALQLQKEINREEEKRAREREREERQREQQATTRKASNNASGSNRSNSGSSNNQSATDVADAWDARIEAAKEQAAKEAVEQFMKQLKDEAKRRS